MSDSIVVTATAYQMAKADCDPAASDRFRIHRLEPEPTDHRRHTPVSQRLIRMVGELAEQAGLDREQLAGPATGIVSGSRYGCALVFDMHRRLRDKGPRGIDAVSFAQATHNFPVSACAIEYGIRGPGVALVSSAAAGMEALLCAADWLAEHRCQRVIIAAFEDLDGAAARHLHHIAAPDAAPVHEAMALVMLERADSAAARGAPVLAEITDTVTLRAGDWSADTLSAECLATNRPAFAGSATKRLPATGTQIAIARHGAAAIGSLDLPDCLAPGGLIALIQAIQSGQDDWLAGALDLHLGGVAARLSLTQAYGNPQ